MLSLALFLCPPLPVSYFRKDARSGQTGITIPATGLQLFRRGTTNIGLSGHRFESCFCPQVSTMCDEWQGRRMTVIHKPSDRRPETVCTELAASEQNDLPRLLPLSPPLSHGKISNQLAQLIAAKKGENQGGSDREIN